MALPGKKEIKVTASDALEFEPVVPLPPPKGWLLKVLVLLVLTGSGAGAWFFYGEQLKRIWASAEPGIPLVKAAPGPVKVRPENPGGLRIPDRDKLVYDRIQGKTAERTEGDGPSQGRGPERLLPPPEEPLPKPSASGKPAKAEPLKKDAVPSEPAQPEKLVGKAKPQAKPKPVAQVPTIRDVKTAKRPAPPPPPPAPPAAPKSKSPILAAAKRLSKPKAETPAPEKGKQTPTAKLQPPEPKPPTPAPTPTVRPAQAPPPVPAIPKQTAAITPDSQPKPQPIPKSRAYLVQLAAARSPQGARTEWTRLRSKHLDLLGDLGLIVTKADLGPARGIYYRLRAGPIADEAKARQLCKRLAERQVGCLIIKPKK